MVDSNGLFYKLLIYIALCHQPYKLIQEYATGLLIGEHLGELPGDPGSALFFAYSKL